MYRMNPLSLNTVHHLRIIRGIPPIESLGGEFNRIPRGIVIQLGCRTPNAFSDGIGIFGTHGYWYDRYVIVEGDATFFGEGCVFLVGEGCEACVGG